MAKNASKQLFSDVKSFLRTGNFSDLVITCHNDTYNVHKIIVCTRSRFFAKAIQFDAGKEADEGRIDLPGDEPAIIKLLIQYLYQAEYDPLLPPDVPHVAAADAYGIQTEPHSCKYTKGYNYNRLCSYREVCSHHYCGSNCSYNCNNFKCAECFVPPKLNGTADQLVTHSKMYEMGDKYLVSGLKKLSACKFQSACELYWDHPKFAEAADHAFSTTPDQDRGLRDIVCKTIAEHMVLLKKPEIEALLTEFNGLAFGLLKEKAEKNNWLE